MPPKPLKINGASILMVIEFPLIFEEGATVEPDQFYAQKQFYNIEEFPAFLEAITDPYTFIPNLSYVWPTIEKILRRNGWQAKTCEDHGKGFHKYTNILKYHCYAPCLFGRHDGQSGIKCTEVKFSNTRLLDADPWFKNVDKFEPIDEDMHAFLSEISQLPECPKTPKAKAWSGDKQKKFLQAKVDPKVLKNKPWLMPAVEGGKVWANCHYLLTPISKAYHYDITSLYPYAVTLAHHLPNINTVQILNKEEAVDDTKYAYWIQQENGSYKCRVGLSTVPAGSIKMYLGDDNILVPVVDELFKQKNAAPKGSAAYNVAKLEVNSFIGALIQRSSPNKAYRYVDVYDEDEDVVKNFGNDARYPHYYEYIIALARHVLDQYLERANEIGAIIYQVNTDGFFTSEPIPYDKERFLGSLRQEYVAHNLIVFKANAYACDEEICIAGMNPKYYEDNVLRYDLPEIRWDPKQFCYVYYYKDFKLWTEEYEEEHNMAES